jgi:iron complex transport system substrate-binding protein
MAGMSRQVRDHLGRRIEVADPPQRLVSLCPSLTETLFALGLGDRVIGRTGYCVRPADAVRRIPVVGGTRSLSVDAIAALAPDLIIAGKEENDRAQVESLMERHPVFVIEVNSFDDALRAVRDLGEATGTRDEAGAMLKRINRAFDDLSPLEPPVDAAYLVWGDPFMAAGRRTYINDLMNRCGLRNVCAHLESRYPIVSEERLAEFGPHVVLLPSEPYPFGEADAAAWAAKLPRASVLLVDGEMFGWYGARMEAAGPYLAALVRRLAEAGRGNS